MQLLVFMLAGLRLLAVEVVHISSGQNGNGVSNGHSISESRSEAPSAQKPRTRTYDSVFSENPYAEIDYKPTSRPQSVATTLSRQSQSSELNEQEKIFRQAVERDFSEIRLHRSKLTASQLPSESEDSDASSDDYRVEIRRAVRLIEDEIPVGPHLSYQLKNGDVIGSQVQFGSPITYYQPYFELKSDPHFPEILVGGPSNVDDERVLLLVGQSGSGKTSLVYSLLNYLYDCQKEHPFRLALELPNAFEKITDRVITYTFVNTILPYKVTVVDTPGIELPNTAKLIGQWIKHKLDKSGRLRLDALVPVMRQDEGRPTASLISHYKRVKYLFGDDLRSNLLPGQSQPPVLKSLIGLGLPFVHYFSVNNIGFLANNGSVSNLKHSLLYKHSVVSLEALFEAVDDWTIPLLLAKTH